ncbi:MAG: Phosphoglycolate phosphatase [Candidatus Lokiarchaeum sp. GC14_75]|nr:MAG: Phosphoglycolate phosphatase [Candidatus Lokiarchaeum sp. GC14_75]
MQNRKDITAIVWDLDGTIIHFKINSTKARKATIKILVNNGIDKKSLSIKRSILDNTNVSKKIFKQMGYSSGQINKIFKEVDKKISKIEHKAALNAKKIRGIEEVLLFAKKKSLKQAIYTFNKQRHAKISLEKVNLLNYFDVIIGRDNVQNPKPHPEHLLEICDNLNVDPSEILVIGDNFRDIEGAINVGARSIAVLTRLAKIETLQNADKIVEERDIPLKLIREIEKRL